MRMKKKKTAGLRLASLAPVCLLALLPLSAVGQQLLSLDSCRAMALRNNKQMDVQQVKLDIAKNIRKSMRTKYLPHISAIGTYQHFSEPISLLSDDQKDRLSSLGSTVKSDVMNGFGNTASQAMTQMSSMATAMGMTITPAIINGMQTRLGEGLSAVEQGLNAKGQQIVDAFDTDTRNMWSGSIMALQPIYMGGSITAMNRMAKINEKMQSNSADSRRQAVIYDVDKTYWQVVSLKHKKRLAESFLAVVKKLEDDVQKMIAEGVATKSDGLSVSVKVNEAEMIVQKVDDGLTLSKMLLCQMIGLPMNEPVMLADEDKEELTVVAVQPKLDVEQAIENRPELKILDNTVDLTRQTTKLLRAGNMPMVAAMGGYIVSNPSLINGFEKKFRGMWNVGVVARVPLWNWGDVMYKVRASKGATAIAQLELDEAREKIELQVNQNTFHVNEANKRLLMAQSSVAKADENLRMANLGFSEGVITPTTVMEAQTAWLQAKSQLIDAQIDVKLTQVELQKSLGTLTE